MPDEPVSSSEAAAVPATVDAAALWTEVKRLLEDDRERVAASAVQRAGEASLAAYLAARWRAFPADAWVLDQLCRAMWRQNEVAEIESVIAAPLHAEVAWLAAGWNVLIAAKKKDKAALEAGLAAFVRLPQALGGFPLFLEHELASLRSQRELDVALEAAVADGTVGMSFAALHVRRACHRRQWEVREHFAAWRQRAGDRAAEPVAVFLDQIGDAREAAAAVPELIRDFGPWMREQTVLFGKTGYALANSGLHEDTAAWLEGCETREDLQGWLAANHVLALWKQRRYKQAGTVSSAVLLRGLRDRTWNWHVTAAAFDHALSGRGEPAQAVLEMLSEDSVSHPDFAWVLELARSVTRVLRLARSESRRVFNEERRRLQQLANSLVAVEDADTAQERYTLAVEAMARHGRFILWPGQRRIALRRQANPIKSWLWVAGTVLLVFAVLRGCVMPKDGSGALESRPESQEKAKAAPQDSPSSVEIDKLLDKPQSMRGR